MTIGFWNLNNKDLSDLLGVFVIENDIDILYLAEAEPDTIAAFIKKTNAILNGNEFHQMVCSKDKLIILSRFKKAVFEDKSSVYRTSRMIAHKLKIPAIIELNIIGIHFHSKNNWTDVSLAMECATVANAIHQVEVDSQQTNTILIGDFNMNPFEAGMIAANGLHAISELEYASKKDKGREIDNIHYPYFYNPMWNFFGDYQIPYGTYYHRTAGNVSYEWHIFDQVLVRPSLKKYLGKNYVQIITKIGTESLLNSLNRPDKNDYSDHLPITLTLKL